MKSFFFLVMLLLSTVSFSQVVGQYAPDDYVKIPIGVDAQVRFATDSLAILISRNKVVLYEVDFQEGMVVGDEYFFVLRPQACQEECYELKAMVLDFTVSAKQAYRDIEFIKEKNGIK